MLEARIEIMQPIAANAHGDTIQGALKSALDKLYIPLDTTLESCKIISGRLVFCILSLRIAITFFKCRSDGKGF